MNKLLILVALILVALATVSLPSPASADIIYSGGVVRFGKNVRVGGQDFSNRTFTHNRNAVIYLHNGKPGNEGCRWVVHRDESGRPTGSKTQVCHLQSVPQNKR